MICVCWNKIEVHGETDKIIDAVMTPVVKSSRVVKSCLWVLQTVVQSFGTKPLNSLSCYPNWTSCIVFQSHWYLNNMWRCMYVSVCGCFYPPLLWAFSIFHFRKTAKKKAKYRKNVLTLGWGGKVGIWKKTKCDKGNGDRRINQDVHEACDLLT